MFIFKTKPRKLVIRNVFHIKIYYFSLYYNVLYANNNFHYDRFIIQTVIATENFQFLIIFGKKRFLLRQPLTVKQKSSEQRSLRLRRDSNKHDFHQNSILTVWKQSVYLSAGVTRIIFERFCNYNFIKPSYRFEFTSVHTRECTKS